MVWAWFGGAAAGEYLSGYLIEESLSIDNVFVWALILAYFLVPAEYQHRVLFWGIFGALVLRATFIFAGIALIERFDWVLYVFGAFLLYTAGKLIVQRQRARRPQQEQVPQGRPQGRAVDRPARRSEAVHAQSTGTGWRRRCSRCSCWSRRTDVLFAVDSVPAVLAVSREQFIVFASNAFAILGLRAMYFLLADMHGRFTLPAAGPGDHPRLRRREDADPRVVPHPDVALADGDRARAGRVDRLLAQGGAARRQGGDAEMDAAADADRRVHADSDAPQSPVRPSMSDSALEPTVRLACMAIADDDIERIRSTVSIVDVVSAARAAQASRPQLGRVCARSTPSARRRSTCARRPGATSASAATSRATCSRSCRRSSTSTSSAPSSSWPTKAGIQLTLHDHRPVSKERARRKQLVEAMAKAVDWYHDRLLNEPDAAHGPRLPAQPRSRRRRRAAVQDRVGARRLGCAVARQSGIAADLLRDNGLAFTNKRDRMQDAFRARVLFPIFTENGEAVGVRWPDPAGHRTDPAKYKNSPETPIYTKSKTLYGLNWAKGDIVNADQVIVCEGYTDVIGFHRAGLPRAVATCGTAFTEEHVRLLKRYASRVVLAFDADSAGQGAAERFYEWEEKYQVEVSVARFPQGKDPGELAQSDPDALARGGRRGAKPFLGFRLGPGARRPVAAVAGGSGPPRRGGDVGGQRAPQRRTCASCTPARWRPRSGCRSPTSSQSPSAACAARSCTCRPARVARRSGARTPSSWRSRCSCRDWDAIAPWLVEALFADEVYRRAFVAIADAGGDLGRRFALADPEAREVLERRPWSTSRSTPRVEAAQPDRRRRSARARPNRVDRRSDARAGRSRGARADGGAGVYSEHAASTRRAGC